MDDDLLPPSNQKLSQSTLNQAYAEYRRSRILLIFLLGFKVSICCYSITQVNQKKIGIYIWILISLPFYSAVFLYNMLILSRTYLLKFRKQFQEFLQNQKPHINNITLTQDIANQINWFYQGKYIRITKGLINQVLLIWGLVLYFNGQINNQLGDTAFWLWSVLFLQSIFYLKIYLIIIFGIALGLPIYCFYSLYKYCTNRIESQRIINQLNGQPFTHFKRISQTQYSCSICLLDFSMDSMVVKLNCHQDHIFHEVCIKAWAGVSSTCPVCRQLIKAQ